MNAHTPLQKLFSKFDFKVPGVEGVKHLIFEIFINICIFFLFFFLQNYLNESTFA